MARKRANAGRRILRSVAALTAAGRFLADWNRSTCVQPRLAAARFHDAQTILLGALLGAGGLYFLRGGCEHPERDLTLGSLPHSLFWVSRVGGFLFPGGRGPRGRVPRQGAEGQGSVAER